MSSSPSRPERGPMRRPSNTHRPVVSRPGAGGLRFGMFAVCVVRDSEPELNKGKAKPLYDVLVSYADVGSRDTGQGYPYREALAAHLDCSPQTIDRATKYLEQDMGLVSVVRRKVEGKADENDANLYLIHDAWLIQGMPAPAGTPPQLVARYGYTVPGFDVEAWMQENAPDFDLTGWTADHAARKNAQQEEHQERRRAARARKRKSVKKGGDVTDDVTLLAEESEGGGVTGDGTCHVTGDVSGPLTGDALSTTVAQEPCSGKTGVADAVGQGAGGYARAGACESAPDEIGPEAGGCAAPATDIPPQRTTSPRPRTVKTRPRSEAPGFDTVRAALPASVAAPGTRLYTGLHRALNDLLTGNEGARIPRRTPDQVIARINRCWFGQKAEERSAPGYEGADRIRNRSSWLAAAILAQDCPDPACESGRILGSDQPCPVCRERAQERRAARSAVQDAADRMEADTEALRGARAVAEQWETDRAAEEYHVRTGLAQEGMYGEKLHYNVAKHMANWRERHPKPGAASATSPSAPAEEQGAPAAQAAASYGPPNAEYRAWRDSRTTTLPAAIARARADKAAREKGQP